MKFNFEKVTRSQQSLILEWLHKPHINEFFHGEGLKNTIEGLRRFVENDNPPWSSYIGYVDGEPFSYFIVSTIEESQVGEHEVFAKWLEPGKKMITLDVLIGEERFLGKGLAVPMIRDFLSSQCVEADVIFIDPECGNGKAIHVYEKAGFQKLDTFIADWHPVPHWLMRLRK